MTMLEINGYSSEILPIEIPSLTLPERLPTRRDLEQYYLQTSWFRNPDLPYAFIHGVDHHARALIWSHIFADKLLEIEGIEVDKKSLSLASITHDTQRENDTEILNGQQLHAHLASQWVKENSSIIDPNLSPEIVDKTAYINYHHQERLPKKGPNYYELFVFQQADRIDLPRVLGVTIGSVPPWARNIAETLTKSKMLSPWAKDLVPLAYDLIVESRNAIEKNKIDPFTAVLDAGEMLNLIRS